MTAPHFKVAERTIYQRWALDHVQRVIGMKASRTERAANGALNAIFRQTDRKSNHTITPPTDVLVSDIELTQEEKEKAEDLVKIFSNTLKGVGFPNVTVSYGGGLYLNVYIPSDINAKPKKQVYKETEQQRKWIEILHTKYKMIEPFKKKYTKTGVEYTLVWLYKDSKPPFGKNTMPKHMLRDVLQEFGAQLLSEADYPFKTVRYLHHIIEEDEPAETTIKMLPSIVFFLAYDVSTVGM